MEQRFKSLSLFEFQTEFPDIDSCKKYLENEKWKDGYSCIRCENTKFCKGDKEYSRQCTKCRYSETPTANTLFHKVKFDLLKAFYIVYFISTNKKGISSTELSRKLDLRQKTCWSFKRKVMKAMKSSGDNLITGKSQADETVFGGPESGVRGRKNKNKKLVSIAVEKKGNGISRMYAKVIPDASSKSLGAFLETCIAPEACLLTDGWTGYTPLKTKYPNLKQILSGEKGSNFPELHRSIMMLKTWLRGMHHSVTDLQDYLDEYCYRFNRASMKQGIFYNLLNRMVKAKPCQIKGELCKSRLFQKPLIFERFFGIGLIWLKT